MTRVFENETVDWYSKKMTAHATGQTLQEMRESRRKQDAKLQAYLRGATTTIILFVAIIAMIMAASDEFASWLAIAMFPAFIFLLVTLATMADPGRRWNDEPEITESRFAALSKHLTPQDTDLYLIKIHIEAFEENRRTLRHVLFWFWAHNLFALVAVVLAFSVL